MLRYSPPAAPTLFSHSQRSSSPLETRPRLVPQSTRPGGFICVSHMKTILSIFFLCLFSALAQAKDVQVYMMYGQGGLVTSRGFLSLSRQIRRLDRSRIHIELLNWRWWGNVPGKVARDPNPSTTIIIGFSLGANATTWVSNQLLQKRISLMVAYDPSIYAPIRPALLNVSRMLVYHNNGPSVFGHAYIPGFHVETTEISMPHLQVENNQGLHNLTLNAVSRVLSETR